MATAKMRKHFILEGQVQGVGLRFRAEYATQMIPVTGWIKNCEDGVVELELQDVYKRQGWASPPG